MRKFESDRKKIKGNYEKIWRMFPRVLTNFRELLNNVKVSKIAWKLRGGCRKIAKKFEEILRRF